jgi:hypothetical protein
LYMAGAAPNYLAGQLLIGTTTTSAFSLDVNGTARVQSTLISGGGTPLVLTGESFALQAISAGLPSGAVFGTNVANNPSFINILSGNNFWHISNRSSTNANRLGIFNASFTGTTATYTSELLTISTTGSVGIGSTSLTGYTLRTSKNITGAVTSYGVTSEGQIQSDVTSSARMFWTLPSIIGGHAVTDVYHYITGQGTFNGTATNQYGFVASSSLTGATNNFGFWGNVPSGTNRWNIYMVGTADNYFAGGLSIGSTSFPGTNLRVSKNVTGGFLFTATAGAAMHLAGTVQSDVTAQASYAITRPQTAATAFTVADLVSYCASSATIGAGSSVTRLTGFSVESTHIGGVNNYAFSGGLAAATNTWNLYMGGTANNYMAGALTIGSAILGTNSLQINRGTTGGATANTFSIITSAASDVTNRLSVVSTSIGTQAAAFTLGTLEHFRAQQGTFGAGSAVTTQAGFRANTNLVGATSNIGFWGSIPSAANNWNLYMDGTANNYMAGSLGIGSTSLTGRNLQNSKSITGSVVSFAQANEGVIQSDVTTAGVYYRAQGNTAAATFTTDIQYYNASQGTFGAGSTVTNQYGFFADASMVGATNNYAFWGAIPSGTNRWNLYMNGTAANYLAGVLNIGTTTLSGFSLDVNGTARVSGNLTVGNTTNAWNSGYKVIDISNSGIYNANTTSTYYSTNFFVNNAGNSTYISTGTAAAIGVENGSYVFYNAASGTAGTTLSFNERFRIALTGAATFSSSVSAASFIPTSSTIPTNGMYLSGTNTLGFATNGTLDMVINEAGNVAIGTNANSAINLLVDKNITGATIAYGIFSGGTIQSGVTSQARLFQTNARTAAATFTLTNLIHYFANQETFGSGSTVTVQTGFFVEGNFSGATINRGFRGLVPASANNWNLYMDGTANNYMAGSLGIGSTSLTGRNLQNSKNITGSVVSYAQANEGVIQSDVTTAGVYYRAQGNTAAATFTTDIQYYNASQGTFGAGSTVTNQYGFIAGSLTGATNNYGFLGAVPSGTNRWNLYMSGTAANYMAGNLWIGTTAGTTALDVRGSAEAALTLGTSSTVYGRMFADATAVTINSLNNVPLIFSTNASTSFNEKMRITVGGQVSIGNASPNASAILQADSTTQGFLPPRMTTTQKLAIGTPAAGLMVYDTTLNQMSYYNGTLWINF